MGFAAGASEFAGAGVDGAAAGVTVRACHSSYADDGTGGTRSHRNDVSPQFLLLTEVRSNRVDTSTSVAWPSKVMDSSIDAQAQSNSPAAEPAIV